MKAITIPLVVITVGVMGSLLVGEPDRPHVIAGYPRIIDGDTIAFGKTRIRLWGIDAPEMNTARGRLSKRFLDVLIHNERVECYIRGHDRYHRLVGMCYVRNTVDIARWMIKFRMAREWCKYSKGYYQTGCV